MWRSDLSTIERSPTRTKEEIRFHWAFRFSGTSFWWDDTPVAVLEAEKSTTLALAQSGPKIGTISYTP